MSSPSLSGLRNLMRPPHGRPKARETRAEVDEDREVGGPNTSDEAGEGWQPTQWSKGGPCCQEPQEGNMTVAKPTEEMSPGLLRVAERAKRDPHGRILSLARLIDVPALERAYGQLRK